MGSLKEPSPMPIHPLILSTHTHYVQINSKKQPNKQINVWSKKSCKHIFISVSMPHSKLIPENIYNYWENRERISLCLNIHNIKQKKSPRNLPYRDAYLISHTGFHGHKNCGLDELQLRFQVSVLSPTRQFIIKKIIITIRCFSTEQYGAVQRSFVKTDVSSASSHTRLNSM